MRHTCHAIRCNVEVKPELLVCRRHWFKVPVKIRRRVLLHYRRGQCDDGSPNSEWLLAAREAINAVAAGEKGGA